MMKRYPGWDWSSILARTFATGGAISLTGCFAIAFSASRAVAQITLDGSVGPPGTLVGPNYVIPQAVGQTVGTNLFHSFGIFKLLNADDVATFESAGITNILSRVTGGSGSTINGTIRSSSLTPVNIFLINPAGIIFGPNARLDIGGSFVGTTAHAIGFPGDGKFPHHSPIDPNNPLLAVNPNALFFNKTPAGVSVNGSKLAVQPGQNLFLVGGNVIVQDGKLTAPGGRIELGGLAEAGEVRIEYVSDSSDPTGKFSNASLLFHDDLDQANVSLTNATIDASKAGRRAGSAGDVFIVGDQISIDRSNIFSNGKFGLISLNARDKVSIFNNSQVITRGFDNTSDDSGLIKIAATEGSVFVNQSTLSTSNFGSGLAGDIAISAPDKVSINGSGIFSQGDLGNIFIGGDIGKPDYHLLTPKSVEIDNSTLKTTGLGSGIAGNIIIRAHDQIAVENNSEVASRSENDTPSSGDFGFIKLAATQGSVLLNQSTLSTTNSSTGYAGDISISARDEVSILNQSNVLSNGYGGRILIGKSNAYSSSFSPRTVKIDDSTVRAESTVNIAGEISIDATDSISISNIPIAQDSRSRFSTNARGNGVDAGDISLKAGNSVSIANSSITSELEPGITGNAGTIEVEAGSISLTNNTELRTLIYGNGSAGDITLETHGGSVSMDNSRIFSTVESGGSGLGGNIEIYTGSLTMSNIAQLQTLIRGGGKGEAGVIFVETNGGSVSLTGYDPITGYSTGMFSTIEPGADGRTRDTDFLGNLDFSNGDISRAILIDTGTLSLTDGATLNTSTYGIGNAGAVVVVADGNVSLKGGTIRNFVGNQATGNAGGILMRVGSLSIASTSQYAAGLTTETLGQGDAGAIVVLADKDISIRGNESGSESVIASRVAEGTANTSGYIRLDARSLFLRDGGAVNVNNQGLGLAGDIRINMREDVILRDRGAISAIANSGIGGNIFLNSGDFLVLVNGSNVSTKVGAGDGGNVDVGTRYIIAAPFKDNNIDAFADSGTGGEINITANRLYDISEQADAPLSNDIDPTARSGVNGTLTATVLNLDPTQGLSNLPAEAIDPTRLIAETCAPRGGITERQKNQFIVTNRGGLPPDPNAAFPGEAVVTDQGTPNQQNNQPDRPGSTNSTGATPTAIASPQPPENQPDNPGSTNSTSATPIATASPQPPIVEAQGWVYDKNGDIKFTNEAPTVIPNRSQLIPASTCNGLSTKP